MRAMHMKRYTKHLRTMAFALLLVLGAGCSNPSKDLENFNDQISLSNKRLAKAAWEVRKTLAPLDPTNTSGATIKLDKDGRAYEAWDAQKKFLELVKTIQNERKAIKVPPGQTAADLHKAYDEFLKGQERIAKEEFAQMIGWAERRNLPNTERWDKIRNLFQQVQSREGEDMKKLNDAHSKFAEAAGMKLVQTR